jgi:hypothetical protein
MEKRVSLTVINFDWAMLYESTYTRDCLAVLLLLLLGVSLFFFRSLRFQFGNAWKWMDPEISEIIDKIVCGTTAIINEAFN